MSIRNAIRTVGASPQPLAEAKADVGASAQRHDRRRDAVALFDEIDAPLPALIRGQPDASA